MTNYRKIGYVALIAAVVITIVAFRTSYLRSNRILVPKAFPNSLDNPKEYSNNTKIRLQDDGQINQPSEENIITIENNLDQFSLDELISIVENESSVSVRRPLLKEIIRRWNPDDLDKLIRWLANHVDDDEIPPLDHLLGSDCINYYSKEKSDWQFGISQIYKSISDKSMRSLKVTVQQFIASVVTNRMEGEEAYKFVTSNYLNDDYLAHQVLLMSTINDPVYMVNFLRQSSVHSATLGWDETIGFYIGENKEARNKFMEYYTNSCTFERFIPGVMRGWVNDDFLAAYKYVANMTDLTAKRAATVEIGKYVKHENLQPTIQDILMNSKGQEWQKYSELNANLQEIYAK